MELPARLSEVVGPALAQPVRLWVVDEQRYGLLPVIRRVWVVNDDLFPAVTTI
ncbi:MAG: hypothetical protein ABIV50_01155 [Opitutus sp.]